MGTQMMTMRMKNCDYGVLRLLAQTFSSQYYIFWQFAYKIHGGISARSTNVQLLRIDANLAILVKMQVHSFT